MANKNWNEIADSYLNTFRGKDPVYNESLFALYKLCMWVADSKTSDVLFAYTSMHTLMVFQKPLEHPLRLRSQYLKIEPCENGCVEFSFVDTMNADKQWVRIATEEDIVDRLRGFIRQIGWAYHPVL